MADEDTQQGPVLGIEASAEDLLGMRDTVKSILSGLRDEINTNNSEIAADQVKFLDSGTAAEKQALINRVAQRREINAQILSEQTEFQRQLEQITKQIPVAQQAAVTAIREPKQVIATQKIEPVSSEWAAASAKLRAQISQETISTEEIARERQKIIDSVDKEIDALKEKGELTNKELTQLQKLTVERERQAAAIAEAAKISSVQLPPKTEIQLPVKLEPIVSSEWATASAKLREEISQENISTAQITAERERIIDAVDKEINALKGKAELTNKERSELEKLTVERERQTAAIAEAAKIPAPVATKEEVVVPVKIEPTVSPEWAAASAKLRAEISQETISTAQIAVERERIIDVIDKEINALKGKEELTNKERSELQQLTAERERQTDAIAEASKIPPPKKEEMISPEWLSASARLSSDIARQLLDTTQINDQRQHIIESLDKEIGALRVKGELSNKERSDLEGMTAERERQAKALAENTGKTEISATVAPSPEWVAAVARLRADIAQELLDTSKVVAERQRIVEVIDAEINALKSKDSLTNKERSDLDRMVSERERQTKALATADVSKEVISASPEWSAAVAKLRADIAQEAIDTGKITEERQRIIGVIDTEINALKLKEGLTNKERSDLERMTAERERQTTALESTSKKDAVVTATLSPEWVTAVAKLHADMAQEVIDTSKVTEERQRIVGILDDEINALKSKEELTNKERSDLEKMTSERERQAQAIEASGMKGDVSPEWQTAATKLRTDIAQELLSTEQIKNERLRIVDVLNTEINALKAKGELTNKERADLQKMTLEYERQVDALATGRKAGVTAGTREALAGSGAMQASLAAIQQTASQALGGGALGSLGSAFIGGIAGGGVVAAIQAAGQALSGFVAEIRNLVGESDRLANITNTFEKLSVGIGATPTRFIKDLQNATHGLVDETDLMASANRVLLQGLSITEPQITRLIGSITNLALIQGKSVTESFDLVTRALSSGRLSMLAYNIGLDDQTKAQLRLAQTYPESIRSLAEFSIVMDGAERQTAKIGKPIETLGTQLQQMKTILGDFKSKLGEAFGTSEGALALGDAIKQLTQEMTVSVPGAVDTMSGISEALARVLNGVNNVIKAYKVGNAIQQGDFKAAALVVNDVAPPPNPTVANSKLIPGAPKFFWEDLQEDLEQAKKIAAERAKTAEQVAKAEFEATKSALDLQSELFKRRYESGRISEQEYQDGLRTIREQSASAEERRINKVAAIQKAAIKFELDDSVGTKDLSPAAITRLTEISKEKLLQAEKTRAAEVAAVRAKLNLDDEKALDAAQGKRQAALRIVAQEEANTTRAGLELQTKELERSYAAGEKSTQDYVDKKIDILQEGYETEAKLQETMFALGAQGPVEQAKLQAALVANAEKFNASVKSVQDAISDQTEDPFDEQKITIADLQAQYGLLIAKSADLSVEQERLAGHTSQTEQQMHALARAVREATRDYTESLRRLAEAGERLKATGLNPGDELNTKSTPAQFSAVQKYNAALEDTKTKEEALIASNKALKESTVGLREAWGELSSVVQGFGVALPGPLVQVVAMIEGMKRLLDFIEKINAQNGLRIPVTGGGGTVGQMGAKGIDASLDWTAGLPGAAPLGGGGGIGNSFKKFFSNVGPVIGFGGTGAGIGGSFGGGLGSIGGLIGGIGAGAVLAPGATTTAIGALTGLSTAAGGTAAAITAALGPIALAIGAVILGIGIVGQKMKKKTAEMAQDIGNSFRKVIDDYTIGNSTLISAIQTAEAQRNAAITALSGKKGGQEQLGTLLPQMDQAIAQLKAKQKQIIDTFNIDLGILRLPKEARDVATQMDDLTKRIKDFTEAGGSAAAAAEFLTRSLEDLKDSIASDLLDSKKQAIQLLLQEIALEKQKAEIIENANKQISDTLNRGVLSRSRSIAQTTALQIAEIKKARDEQIKSIDEQKAQLEAQVAGQKELFGLTSDEVSLKQALLAIEKQISLEQTLQIAIQKEQLANLIAQSNVPGGGIGGVTTTTGPDFQSALNLIKNSNVMGTPENQPWLGSINISEAAAKKVFGTATPELSQLNDQTIQAFNQALADFQLNTNTGGPQRDALYFQLKSLLENPITRVSTETLAPDISHLSNSLTEAIQRLQESILATVSAPSASGVQQLTVGSITVNVDGNTNMNSADMTSAVRRAIDEAYADLQASLVATPDR